MDIAKMQAFVHKLEDQRQVEEHNSKKKGILRGTDLWGSILYP